MKDQQLKATLISIRYHKDGFLIAGVKCGDGNILAVKGNMPTPQIGLIYTFTGVSRRDPKWGPQFDFHTYESHYPTSTDAIESYLVDNCKGVGKGRAASIAKEFGEKAIETCKNDPSLVAEKIKGVTKNIAQEMQRNLMALEETERLQLSLKELLGGSRVPRTAYSRILKKWGDDAIAIINGNPFILCEEITGIGFATADDVAHQVGYSPHGGFRVKAGISHVLSEAANANGHVCLPVEGFYDAVTELLNIDESYIPDALEELIDAKKLIEVDQFIYLRKLYEAEKTVAEKLQELSGRFFDTGTPDYTGLFDDQKEALSQAVSRGVFILTGPPGTGKTYTIKRIVEAFEGHSIALAAPTGKAAKRMIEQTGMDASTIHKLLGPVKTEDGFRFEHSKNNPLPYELVILDEVSMIDIRLFAQFIEALKPTARLILVGDRYQLPAIGPGNVLKDLINSGAVPTIELSIIKRQDPGLIVTNCHAIKAGLKIQKPDGRERENWANNDFVFIEMEDAIDIKGALIRLATSSKLPNGTAIDPSTDVQVITPLRSRTDLSCKSLNQSLQPFFAPDDSYTYGKFRVGDKVIQTRNDYKLDIINGDIGYIVDILKPVSEIVVSFTNPVRQIHIPANDHNLDLAYAITCHKFQGSEAPIIIIPIHNSFGRLIMQRNWLYTAISRAQKMCVIIGQSKEVAATIYRNDQRKRHTRLASILKQTVIQENTANKSTS